MNQLRISLPPPASPPVANGASASSPDSGLNININTITLHEILNLQFQRDVPDSLKLSFIKTLLIKLTTKSPSKNTTTTTVSPAYTNLIHDLDEDLNTKLNTLFKIDEDSSEELDSATKSFQTLDPAVKLKLSSPDPSNSSLTINALPSTATGSSEKLTTITSNQKQSTVSLHEAIVAKKHSGNVSTTKVSNKSLDPQTKSILFENITPSATNRDLATNNGGTSSTTDSPYNHSNASSDYAPESGTAQSEHSNYSSNYTSRNNSKQDLPSSVARVPNSESRNSSIYSPKSVNNISESISSTKLSNSPSATYNNTRIQLPSPRNETNVNIRAKDNNNLDKSIKNSPRTVPLPNNSTTVASNLNKALSPIAFVNDQDDTIVDGEDINPFDNNEQRQFLSPRNNNNKSSDSLPINKETTNNSTNPPDIEQEMEKERLRRNPNRILKNNLVEDLTPGVTKPLTVTTSASRTGTLSEPIKPLHSQSARSSPVIGRNTPVVKGSPRVYSDSERTPKMYGTGIMGLDSPLIARRDISPSSPRTESDIPTLQTNINHRKANPTNLALSTSNSVPGSGNRIPIANNYNARDRYYQNVKKQQPQYSTYTNLTNQQQQQQQQQQQSEKRHVKSPTLSSMSAATTFTSSQFMQNPGESTRMVRSQPTTPQSPAFLDLPLTDNELIYPNDPSLFIQPKDLHTISLNVITSLSISKNNSSTSYDPTIVFATIDKVSQKEIWRFKKTYSQLARLDHELRSMFESFLLPPLPEKTVFLNNLPAKIDIRRNGILDYFTTLLSIPKLPIKAVMQVCKFISTNTVNPLDDIEYNFSNDINEKDFKKQGYLIRRNKGLGANWRVRYCRCEGPYLLVFDDIDGNLLESIKLTGAQIGRQQSDSAADESSSNAKGYRHALLLKELKKNSIGSGTNKHIFCAESDEERDSWIDVLIEYVQEQADDLEPADLINYNNNAGSTTTTTASSTINSNFNSNTNNNLNISNSFSSSTLMSTPRHGSGHHGRTKSTDLSLSSSNQHFFNSSTEASSPIIVSPKQDSLGGSGFGAVVDFEDPNGGGSGREPKKARKRFFGGIRNKLGNSNTGANAALSPNDYDNIGNTSLATSASGLTTATAGGALGQGSDDFPMNPVTDLSGYSNDTSYNNLASPLKTDALAYSSDAGLITSTSSTPPIFGQTLEEAYRLSGSEFDGKKVPSIVFRCLDYLSQTGAGYQEGIFRLSGSSTMIKLLREKFDTEYDVDLANMDIRPEINGVTGLLKLYLRELPENILTTEINTRLHGFLSDYNKNLANGTSQLTKIKVDEKNNNAYLTYIYQTKSVINQLPSVNKDVLYVLIRFLNQEVLARAEYNKMNLRNLVIVFSATLNIDSKILAEFFINFNFLWEGGELVNESDRPDIEIGSIPLV